MRSTYLTSACESFSYEYENNKLTLTWKINFDFTNVLYIGLLKFQLIGVMSEDYELLPVYCNLIERTSCNPLREIHRASIDPYVNVINDKVTGILKFRNK